MRPTHIRLIGFLLAFLCGLVGYFVVTAGGPPTAPPRPRNGPVAQNASGGSGGRPIPTPVAERSTMDVFVPEPLRAELSPVFVSAAEWPTSTALQPVPAPAANELPEPELRNLRELVENWLAEAVRPEDFAAALGGDDQGRVFVRLRTPPGTTIAGRASTAMTPTLVTFAFAIEFPNASGPVDASGVMAWLRAVVHPDVVAELSRPEFAPHPHPTLRGGDAWSGIARLDRNGCGAIHPLLYLFATRTKLLGVFQQVPHGMAPEGK